MTPSVSMSKFLNTLSIKCDSYSERSSLDLTIFSKRPFLLNLIIEIVITLVLLLWVAFISMQSPYFNSINYSSCSSKGFSLVTSTPALQHSSTPALQHFSTSALQHSSISGPKLHFSNTKIYIYIYTNYDQLHVL